MPVEETQEVVANTPEPKLGIPRGNLILSVCRNAASQLGGRNLISLGRLIVASTIARTYGKEMFGRYSLIIALLGIAEWIIDFGTSDVFVREICRDPNRGERLMRILTALKVLQIAVGAGGFTMLILLMRYPAEVTRAGYVAVGSLLFFGGTLIYHTIFKATLTIEREMLAEFVSVLFMIGVVRVVARHGGSLAMLCACYMGSRAVFCGICWALGRSRFHLSLRGVTWPDMVWGIRSSAAIGAIGLMVVLYEALDLLLLSRLGTLGDVGLYSGAQRFIAPMVAALTAIGGTLYPVAASFWPDSRGLFERSCQRAMDTVFLLAGFAICAIVAGSDLLMRLLGPDLAAGANILRVLTLLLFVKAISNTLGPILYVVRAQNVALWLVIAAVLMKASLIALLAPHFGYIGVAVSAVVTDSATALATLWLLKQRCDFRVQWSVPARVSAISLAAAWFPRAVLPAGSLLAPVLALAVFVPGAFLTGAIKVDEVRAVLKRGAA